jgi:P27 family predicted phage terminase small subunit
MPTKAVSVATMEVGKKGKGKHWTKAQVSAREEAAKTLQRAEPIPLKPPSWLSAKAKKIWEKKLKETQGVELLDVLDEESLAVYCDSFVKYEEISKAKILTLDDHKTMQAYSRIIAQYADKLGFTPAARARLIKKRADEKPDPFGREFD